MRCQNVSTNHVPSDIFFKKLALAFISLTDDLLEERDEKEAERTAETPALYGSLSSRDSAFLTSTKMALPERMVAKCQLP